MYQSRDIVSQGSQNIRTGTHCFGTSRHLTTFFICKRPLLPGKIAVGVGQRQGEAQGAVGEGRGGVGAGGGGG